MYSGGDGERRAPDDLPRALRWLLTLVGTALGLVIVAGVVVGSLHALGWCLGPWCDKKPDPRTAACKPAHEAYARRVAEAETADAAYKAYDPTAYTERQAAAARFQAATQLIVAIIQQNGSCFSVEDRAAAEVWRSRSGS